ncbi:D-alanine--D-alanine ligase [Opitutaceae bacterium TAV5]|nr:D-alanine--D-alanine ligase [Opitutaceae bacterium TAV5]
MTPSAIRTPHSSFRVVVLAGGTSSEREVSLGSGRACALALANTFPTRLVEVSADALPPGLDPARDIVFSTLHGTFGEDGRMQRLLDAAGITYAGCDAASSALTMDKSATKAAAARAGVQVAPEVVFTAGALPSAADLVAALGPRVVIKPNAEGSSVGLHLADTEAEIAAALAQVARASRPFPEHGAGAPPAGGAPRHLAASAWLAEPRLVGRELSIGVLNGRALGVVEIRPRSGVYDYTSKYTKGRTEYLAPAPLPEATTALVRAAAESAFAACGCRDYARIDFILCEPDDDADAADVQGSGFRVQGSGNAAPANNPEPETLNPEPARSVSPGEQNVNNPLYLLEINTLPGMKETSLLPMSARCAGLDFTALVRELVRPAIRRFAP